MKKYKVLYVDPPWVYNNKKTGGSMRSGSQAKYPTMDLKSLMELPVQNITDKNSVLFLWATTPMLPEAFELMKAWGYKYKTSLYWEKTGKLGIGYYYRNQVEQLLLGIKGKIPAFRIPKRNIVSMKSVRHSHKPEVFYEMIEMTGLEPKVELFACVKRDGWDCAGYDANGVDVRDLCKQQ